MSVRRRGSVANLLDARGQATPDEVEYGFWWWDREREDQHDAAQYHKLRLDTVCHITAQLSSNQEWERNVAVMHTLCTAWRDGGKEAVHNATMFARHDDRDVCIDLITGVRPTAQPIKRSCFGWCLYGDYTHGQPVDRHCWRGWMGVTKGSPSLDQRMHDEINADLVIAAQYYGEPAWRFFPILWTVMRRLGKDKA